MATHKRKSSTPKKRGPKPRVIDYALVRRLAGMGCTDAEIGCALQFTKEWICKRKQMDLELAEAIEQGREGGRRTLRRLQWHAAKKGNPTMLIWLGKQLLGQRDKHELSAAMVEGGEPTQPPVTINLTLVDENEKTAETADLNGTTEH